MKKNNNKKTKQMKRKGMRSICIYGDINNLINTFMIFEIELLGQNCVEIGSLEIVRVSQQIYKQYILH